MEEKSYSFKLLSNSLPTFLNKELHTYFEKWNLANRLKTWKFSFDGLFQSYMKNKFAEDFFNNDEVLKSVQMMSYSGGWGPLPKPDSVVIEDLDCSVTSMTFFDTIKEEGIARESGSICKCLDEVFDGITISDELRKMILDEDSDNFECFSDAQRNELMFKVFTHLVIGGPICQYEDIITPYLDVTKSLYKDLVTVQKSNSGELNIISKAFKVSGFDRNGSLCYPSTEEHIQSFAYLVIDPLKRHVTLLYHSWGKGMWY